MGRGRRAFSLLAFPRPSFRPVYSGKGGNFLTSSFPWRTRERCGRGGDGHVVKETQMRLFSGVTNTLEDIVFICYSVDSGLRETNLLIYELWFELCNYCFCEHRLASLSSIVAENAALKIVLPKGWPHLWWDCEKQDGRVRADKIVKPMSLSLKHLSQISTCIEASVPDYYVQSFYQSKNPSNHHLQQNNICFWHFRVQDGTICISNNSGISNAVVP